MAKKHTNNENDPWASTKERLTYFKNENTTPDPELFNLPILWHPTGIDYKVEYNKCIDDTPWLARYWLDKQIENHLYYLYDLEFRKAYEEEKNTAYPPGTVFTSDKYSKMQQKAEKITNKIINEKIAYFKNTYP